ncbi:MAG: (Fe-S)-binding protein [Acidimicrobiales bacterium]
MDLHIDNDQLGSCVSCGLCLPHCPTYRVTGDETRSPRGRISAMRQVQWHGLAVDDSFIESMDTCVQCRGCETACPSGVPFGRLMEATRATLAREVPSYQPWWRRFGYRLLRHHRLLLALSTLAALGQRLHLVPSQRLGLSPLPLRRPKLVASGDPIADSGAVWLFTGCVMDAWQRDIHGAAQRVLEATGAGVCPSGSGAACCGALAMHAGLEDEAKRAATATMRALRGDAPIIVDSAGCGAMLKDYGHLFGTDEATHFSARVLDIHEWLAPRLDTLPAARGPRDLVAVQDPCHLRHVQRAHLAVRTVLAPFADVVELDDDGLCCGAGGAYSALHPDLAADIRKRKLASIDRAGAPTVVSANPGCSMHLAAAGVSMRHPIQIIDQAIRGNDAR